MAWKRNFTTNNFSSSSMEFFLNSSSIQYQNNVQRSDEEILKNLAQDCAKLVLDDLFMSDFKSMTLSSGFYGATGTNVGAMSVLHQSCISMNLLAWQGIRRGQNGTGVFHPPNKFLIKNYGRTPRRIPPPPPPGTGVFLGKKPQTKDHEAKDCSNVESGKNMQASAMDVPKKNEEDTMSFEMFEDVRLPSEWPY